MNNKELEKAVKKFGLSKRDLNTLLKIYPYYTNSELARIFRCPVSTIKTLADIFGVVKKNNTESLKRPQGNKTGRKKSEPKPKYITNFHVYRTKHNLTYADLSRATGFNSSYLNQIETGTVRISYKLAVRLAELYGVPVSKFYPG